MNPATNAVTPREVARGPAPVAGSLPVGSPGKLGRLELCAEFTGTKTEITRRLTSAPLHLMRPLYVDTALPTVPICYAMSSGGGIVGGDRLYNSISVGSGAHVVVTSQAATKIYRSDGGHSSQTVEIDVGPNAICEWVPDAIVPFAGSRFHQRCRARVHESGVLTILDIVTAGRVARHERWNLDSYVSTIEITRPDGSLLVVDTTRLRGGEHGGGPVVAGNATAIGTCMVVAPGPAADLVAALRHAFPGAQASALPDECGAMVRVLGHSVEQVHRYITAAWSMARMHYADAPAPPLRKM